MKFNMNKWYSHIFIGKNRTFFGLDNRDENNPDFLPFVQTNAFVKKTHIRYDIYVIRVLDEWKLDINHSNCAWIVVDKTTMQYVIHRFWDDENQDSVNVIYSTNSVLIVSLFDTCVIAPDKNGKISKTHAPFDKKEKQDEFNKQVINLDCKEQVVELYNRDFSPFDMLFDSQHCL